MKRRHRYLGFAAAAVMSMWVSLASPGAEPGWNQQEDGWYYYLEDGSPAAGWVEDEGKSYYLLDGGKALTDGMTPDGYYVDHSGAWYERKETILDIDFAAPRQRVSPDSLWAGKEALMRLRSAVGQKAEFGGTRRLKVSEKEIEYILLEETKANTVNETVVLGIYREPDRGRFRLDVAIDLGSVYGYGIFRAMMYQVSSSPELLADGIYSAWEEDNRFGIRRREWVRIGDSQVYYVSGDGYGRFYIRPAGEGN